MLDTTTEAGGRAGRRLREEAISWLTMVRADGQPQSVPVWFLWDGGLSLYDPVFTHAPRLKFEARLLRGKVSEMDLLLI